MFVIDLFFVYIFVVILFIFISGFDIVFILCMVIVEGGCKVLYVVLGIDFGCFIWGVVVVFGLGVLLEVFELVYILLKWCGVGYFCWLGIQLFLCLCQ